MSFYFYIPLILLLAITMATGGGTVPAQFETDTIPAAQGDLHITFIGHGTLMFEYNGKVIHVDPVSRYADYSKMPKADLVLVTHQHGDHLDPQAIGQIRKEGTVIICNEMSSEKLEGETVLHNGESRTVEGIETAAVPAYNRVHLRDSGRPYHPKGEGNGYVITMGGKRIYVAGDTENIPEMKNLPEIDIAFLPMNLPYTMTPEMAADAARMVKPKVLYPYHYGDTDVNRLPELLKDEKSLEVRVRNLQ